MQKSLLIAGKSRSEEWSWGGRGLQVGRGRVSRWVLPSLQDEDKRASFAKLSDDAEAASQICLLPLGVLCCSVCSSLLISKLEQKRRRSLRQVEPGWGYNNKAAACDMECKSNKYNFKVIFSFILRFVSHVQSLKSLQRNLYILDLQPLFQQEVTTLLLIDFVQMIPLETWTNLSLKVTFLPDFGV